MIHLLLLAATLAASPSIPATGTSARAAIQAYIHQCEAEWAQGAVKDNSAIVATFIANDYHGVSSRGKVHGKAEMLAPSTPPGQAAGLYYAKVHFTTPTLAIVQGEEWWKARNGPKHHLIWTDSWLYRAGKWQIVASQDSEIPADQPLQK
jgi:hypothetical protein